MKIVVLVWSALLASAVPALAQEQERVPGMGEQRFVELTTWLKEYDTWEKWFERWGNRVVHNFNEQMILERKRAARAAGLARGGMSGRYAGRHRCSPTRGCYHSQPLGR